jgi:hypothetical protein
MQHLHGRGRDARRAKRRGHVAVLGPPRHECPQELCRRAVPPLVPHKVSPAVDGDQGELRVPPGEKSADMPRQYARCANGRCPRSSCTLSPLFLFLALHFHFPTRPSLLASISRIHQNCHLSYAVSHSLACIPFCILSCVPLISHRWQVSILYSTNTPGQRGAGNEAQPRKNRNDTKQKE